MPEKNLNFNKKSPVNEKRSQAEDRAQRRSRGIFGAVEWQG